MLVMQKTVFKRVLLVAAWIIGGACQVAQAATIIVNDTEDALLASSVGVNSSCTLREAFTSLNQATATPQEPPNTGPPRITGCQIFGSFGNDDRIEFSGALEGQTVNYSFGEAGLGLFVSVEFNRNARNVTLNASGVSRGFATFGDGIEVIFNNLTLTGGDTSNAVDGMSGGSIFVQNGATVIYNNCTITGNTAASESGGAILAIGSGTEVRLNNSTVSSNSAAFAGAILALDSASVIIENSTVSGNTARVAGGAADVASGASITLRASTVFNNSSPSNSIGGIRVFPQGNLNFQSSILAGSTFSDCFVYNGGNVTSDSSSIIQDPNTGTASCAANARTGIAPGLQALANNGGPTMTHALTASSPALNTGTLCLSTDQRGQPRPSNNCDVGAFEAPPPPPPPPPPPGSVPDVVITPILQLLLLQDDD